MMRTLHALNTHGLSSLMFYATLLAQGAYGCSSKVNGFIPLGGDTGGTYSQPSASTGGDPNFATTGGTSSIETSPPGVTGGSTAISSVAQGGNGLVISTSVAVVEPTCTGTPVSEQQMTAIADLASQNENCKVGSMLAEPAMVSILLLVDTTDAMTLPVQGGAARRWDVVERGILGFAEAFSATTFDIGVGFYGAYGATTRIANCGIDAYVSPAIPLGRIANNQAELASKLTAMRDKLDAPSTLYPALEGSLSYASAWRASHQENQVAVVLVTDGRTQVCDKTLADDYALVQSYAQRDPATQVRTFVVGVAGDQASLDYIAQGGGTDRSYLVDGPDASDQFVASLKNVVASLTSWFVPGVALGSVQPAEPAYVVVDSSTRGTYVVPRIGSASDCDSTSGGWYYTTNSGGEAQATFCACSRPNVNSAGLSWYYGCTLPFYPGD